MIEAAAPGPALFTQQPDLVWGLIASLFLANVILLVMNIPLVGVFTKVLSVPNWLLVPGIVAVSSVGVYAVHATEGNFNNDIGVPLTLLRLRAQHRLSVVELGMNHPGEIERLACMAAPTVALVNNAQREHQEFMASVEAVARENGAVIDALGASGTAVYPADDATAATLRAAAA